jgi:hypothetical protein
VVAEFHKLEILQEIWRWDKEKLTTEDLNKILSTTDDKGRTVLQVAAKDNKIHSVQEILK